LGTVTSTGEVALNGARVLQLATIYADDTVETGANGNAALKLQGKGEIWVHPGTLVKFPDSPRYLAQLEHGQVSLRPLPDGKGFHLRVGNYVIVPDPDIPETAAIVGTGAGNRVHVKAVQGSVRIIDLDGTWIAHLQNGQERSFVSDRNFAGGTSSHPSTATPELAKSGGGRTGLILLGVGAAGAAGAAVGLSGGDSTPSVSPFTP
jgi:hypothetical protein